jgi:hypothetical protein
MGTILDYLNWRMDVPLRVAPFNPVDNLILSVLSYLPLKGCEGKTIAEVAPAVCAQEQNPSYRELMRRMGQGARFGAMRLVSFWDHFSEEEEKQFAAVTVELGDGTSYAAFRGTDVTLVGWKEDFNMGFADVVPAQTESVRYLNEVAGLVDGALRVGGHSKGGNLAVYAALFCGDAVRARVREVYNNDGPGLTRRMQESPAYSDIEPRVKTYLPQTSIIGMLMEHSESYQVVRSEGFGIMQHDPFTWQAVREDFIKEGGLRAGSLYVDKTIKQWMSTVSVEDRRAFIEAVYRILSSTGAKSVNDLMAGWRKNLAAILTETSGFDQDTRRLLRRVVGLLFAAGAKNLVPIGQTRERDPHEAPPPEDAGFGAG